MNKTRSNILKIASVLFVLAIAIPLWAMASGTLQKSISLTFSAPRTGQQYVAGGRMTIFWRTKNVPKNAQIHFYLTNTESQGTGQLLVVSKPTKRIVGAKVPNLPTGNYKIVAQIESNNKALFKTESKTFMIKNGKNSEKQKITSPSQRNPYFGTACASQPKVAFAHDFTDVNLIQAVEPTIITPGNSRHRAWLDINTAATEKVPVYAPVDSELVEGIYKSARGATDYDLHFQVSCEIWYLINHITDPVDSLKNVFPSTPAESTKSENFTKFSTPIKVKAGQLLGYTSGTPLARNFDFGVFDLNHFNKDLPTDSGSIYGKEKNFICPFNVLPEATKNAYYSKIIDAEKPFTNCTE